MKLNIDIPSFIFLYSEQNMTWIELSSEEKKNVMGSGAVAVAYSRHHANKKLNHSMSQAQMHMY